MPRRSSSRTHIPRRPARDYVAVSINIPRDLREGLQAMADRTLSTISVVIRELCLRAVDADRALQGSVDANPSAVPEHRRR